MLGKLALVYLKQRTEIGRHPRKRIRLDLLKPQFRDDVRYCAGESGPARQFRVSAKPTSLGQCMNRAVRDCLGSERREWNGSLRRQHWTC